DARRYHGEAVRAGATVHAPHVKAARSRPDRPMHRGCKDELVALQVEARRNRIQVRSLDAGVAGKEVSHRVGDGAGSERANPQGERKAGGRQEDLAWPTPPPFRLT